MRAPLGPKCAACGTTESFFFSVTDNEYCIPCNEQAIKDLELHDEAIEEEDEGQTEEILSELRERTWPN